MPAVSSVPLIVFPSGLALWRCFINDPTPLGRPVLLTALPREVSSEGVLSQVCSFNSLVDSKWVLVECVPLADLPPRYSLLPQHYVQGGCVTLIIFALKCLVTVFYRFFFPGHFQWVCYVVYFPPPGILSECAMLIISPLRMFTVSVLC